MALDWLPRYPDQASRRKIRASHQQSVSRHNLSPIPIPAPPTELIWLPHFPDQAARKKRPAAQDGRSFAPIVDLSVFQALSWYPHFPDTAKRKTLSAAHMPASPWQYSSIDAIARLGWHPTYPDQATRHRPINLGLSYLSGLNGDTLFGPCVHWEDLALTAAALTGQACLSADLLNEALTTAGFVSGDLCALTLPTLDIPLLASDGTPILAADGTPILLTP